MKRSVHEIIKERRESLGYSLNELAERIGVNRSTVMRWENGDIENMKRDKIVSLSESLKISPAVIMGWEDIEEPKVAKVTDTVKDINTLVSKLDQSSQERLLAYAQGMYDIQNQDKKGGIAHVETKS
jgi:transcriptional regulator with XRE-family HTH domain